MDGQPDAAIVSSGMQVASGAEQAAGEMLQAGMELPLGIVLAGNAAAGADGGAGSYQGLGRAAQKAAIDAIGSKNANLTNAADAGINKTGLTASGSHDASSAGGQSSGQSPQGMQGDSSQSVSTLPKAADSSTFQLQAQTVVTPGPAHEITAATRTPDGLADAPRATDQREVPGSTQSDSGEGMTTSGINSAKLIQAMSGTEMRVGMHSSEFGDISIRTSVSQQQMLAQISLDHSELSQAMSAHISSVQAKLGDEYGIHASIEIDNQGSSLSGDSGQSSQRQHGSSAGLTRGESAADPAEADMGISTGMLVAAGNGRRLDIRA